VVWGENDRLIPPVYAQSFHKAISDSQLLMLPACGHEPPLEQCEALLSGVQTFYGN